MFKKMEGKMKNVCKETEFIKKIEIWELQNIITKNRS